MVQIFDASPTESSASLSGSALAKGLGIRLQQQQQQKAQQQMQGVLSKVLTGQASPEDLAQLPPEIQLEIFKQRNKPAPGGLSGQAVPPEVAQMIPKILNENKGATADELAVKLDEAGVPRAYSNSYIENRRRQDESAVKQSDVARKERLAFHKESQKYDEKLTDQADSAKNQLTAIERQRKVLPEMNNWDRISSAVFGKSPLQNLFKSASAQEFDSAVLPLLEGARDTFGSRLTDADLRVVLQKIATSDKNPEAIKKILAWQELDAKMKIEKRKLADQIKKKEHGLRPLDFSEQLRELMDEKFGKQIENTATEIMQLGDDPKKAAQITRQKVPPGTPLNAQAIDKYLEMANYDDQEAERLAREDGYEF